MGFTHMAFPKTFLDQLRSQVSLSDVIGRRVSLKLKGKEYSGLCPFHNEKTPSFTVNNDKGFYHCFGCGAHGDAIEFIKRYERSEYVESVKMLAREAGIPVPENTERAREQVDREQQLLNACEEAARWFEANLKGEKGVVARQYIEKRRLTPEIVTRFRLGYAPDLRDGLRQALMQKGFSESVLAEAGLIVNPDYGNAYDRFRGRLMFPIRNSNGRVVAFGGRLIVPQNDATRKLPKYLNSSETPVFKKRDMLFNLDQAGRAARHERQMIVVEGYMDVIACVQAGIEQTVATLGTAFTSEHVGVLWNYADTPTLCLDGDSAGKRAMLRAAELVLPQLKPGKSLKFALLPKGEDPDSFIQHKGISALKDTLSGARDLHDALWSAYSSQYRSPSPDIRAKLERLLNDLTGKIQDPTVRSHYRAFFRKAMWRGAKQGAKKPGSGKQVANQNHPRSLQLDRMMHSPEEMAIAKTARQLLKLVLVRPTLLEHSDVEDALDRLECVADAMGELKAHILDFIHIAPAEAELEAWLLANGLEHVLRSLKEDNSIILPKHALEDGQAALGCVRQWMEAYDILMLEEEYRRLTADSGDGDTMERYGRALALHQEISERKQESIIKGRKLMGE